MKIDVILGAGLSADQVDSLGRLADEYGINRLWGSHFPSRRDPWLLMAGLARTTRRIGLGTMPISPYEVHPLRIADTLLTFNELCSGRAAVLIGGLGHSVMRVTGLTPTHRLTAVRDCVQILKAIRTDAMCNYEGEQYSLMNYQPEWAAAPPPKIYVGSTGPTMLKMSAAIADGIMMSDVPLQRMSEVLEHIDRGLAGGGRQRADIRLNNFFAWHIKENRAASMSEARRELVWRGLLQKWHTSTFLGDDDAEFVETNRDAFLQAFLTQTDQVTGVPEKIVDALVENLTFAGDFGAIDGVVRHLQEFEKAGLNEVALKVHDDPAEAIRTIGERLVPALS